jgi:hypothetical protein
MKAQIIDTLVKGSFRFDLVMKSNGPDVLAYHNGSFCGAGFCIAKHERFTSRGCVAHIGGVGITDDTYKELISKFGKKSLRDNKTFSDFTEEKQREIAMDHLMNEGWCGDVQCESLEEFVATRFNGIKMGIGHVFDN